MEYMVLKLQNLPEQLLLLANSPHAKGGPSVTNHIHEAYVSDSFPGKILGAIWTQPELTEITIAHCMEIEGQIQYRGKLYVAGRGALRVWLIQEHHDTAMAGHPGRAKTFDLLILDHLCKEMPDNVNQYVQNCSSYQLCWSSQYSISESFDHWQFW